jgi:hypothetical protein
MRRVLLLILFCFSSPSEAVIGPQMKDFLCGCEHCQTVDKGEPLDIANHMIRCHSWRKGMQKTLELMSETPKPKVKIKKKSGGGGDTKSKKRSEVLNKDYSWKEDENYGWIYCAEKQTINILNTWIYSEHLGWVWPFTKFMYSDKYGWIYNIKYKNKRIMYWYDRRIWLLPKTFSTIKF